MNVFKRLSDIISSNVNSALDKMEDPEKMIDLSITELEDAISEMNATLAERRVQLSSLEKLIKGEQESITRWSERAVLAAKNNQDDMAREAIAEKQKLASKLKTDEESYSNINSLLATLADSKAEASAKLTDMKAKSLELKTRAKVAKSKLNTNEKISKTEDAAWARRMEEMKSKIEKWEAMADLTKSPIDNKPSFDELEKNEAVEKELAAIKASNKAEKGTK